MAAVACRCDHIVNAEQNARWLCSLDTASYSDRKIQACFYERAQPSKSASAGTQREQLDGPKLARPR